MAYYRDGTPYSYRVEPYAALNIGWLDPREPFRTELPSEGVLDRIWSYCLIMVNVMRGVHRCELCAGGDDSTIGRRHGRQVLLGYYEIRVFGADGTIYAAPSMIFHDLEAHHYQPPGAFLDAVLNTPPPPTRAYTGRLDDLPIAWSDAHGPTHTRRLSSGQYPAWQDIVLRLDSETDPRIRCPECKNGELRIRHRRSGRWVECPNCGTFVFPEGRRAAGPHEAKPP